MHPRPTISVANSGPVQAGAPPCTLVSLAAVTWDFRLVGRTRMLTEAWQALGQPTIFVQVPSLRSGLQRLTGLPRPRGAVTIVRPWPTYPARWWSRLGLAHVTRSIRRRAAALRRNLDELLPWERAVAVVISPVWTAWLAELPFRRVIYDCIDELAVHVPHADLTGVYRNWENGLIERADGAVVTARALGETLRARRPGLPIALIRNGVDVEHFARLAANAPRPADVSPRGRPTVGFVGALYEWIDWNLIRATARQLPQIEFVLVGPTDRRAAAARLADLPNVHVLGPRAYAHVPAYIAAFDACWVPFKQDAVGQAANPVKIYEYLALGKPVVTTPVADTDSFEGLVQVAHDADEMVMHLRAATAAPSDAAVRVAFARQNSWTARARQYLDFVSSLA